MLRVVKIGIVTESFLPQVNGVTNSVLRICEQFARRDVEAMVVAPGPGSTQWCGFPVVRTPSVPLPGYRDFRLAPQKFDLVYCAANSFQHMLTTDDQLATLRCVASHLAPGGVYVMQLRALRAIDWGAERTPLYLRWTRPIPATDDRLMRFDSTTIAAAAQTATTTHFFDRVSPDGTVSRRIIEYTLRYTGLAELRTLHDAAGLRATHVYGDTDLSPYDDGSDTMIVVAEAKES